MMVRRTSKVVPGAAVRVHILAVMAKVADVVTALGTIVAQFALIVTQFPDVMAALGISVIQRLTVVPDFGVVAPYFGAFLCNTPPVATSFGGAQLVHVLMEFPVVAG